MKHTIIPVSELTQSQMKEVAHLHHAVMHSLLTDIGLPVVERYYQLACKDSSVVGFVIVSESGKLLGWAIGSPRPDQLNARLREAPLWFLSQMLRVLLSRPSVLGQIWASLQTTSAPMPGGAIELTYIGVDPSIRKQGVGRDLLQAFFQAARSARYQAVVLSVEVENTKAIALYTKTGFAITGTFTEGSFHRHRMELTL
jgi:ribosomal protein S18 acetylase RimI-like enzyme